MAALYRICIPGFVYPDLGLPDLGYQIWPTAPGKPDMPPRTGLADRTQGNRTGRPDPDRGRGGYRERSELIVRR